MKMGNPGGLYPDLVCETIEAADYEYEDGEPRTYEKPVCYVSVYAITRHRGGPEEGGWYYNWTAHELSIPLIQPGDKTEIEQVIAFLKPRFEDQGDIYSVRGGVAYSFSAECTPGSAASTERPHYE